MGRFVLILAAVVVFAGLYTWQPSAPAAAFGHTHVAVARKTCKIVKKHGQRKRVCHALVTAASTSTLTATPAGTLTVTPTTAPTATATVTPTATPSPTPIATRTETAMIGPRAYYLALGDSVAYGYQPDFDLFHGYPNYFYVDLHRRGTTHLVNMACPGESSTTFIRGGCPFSLLLKHRYTGPQFNAALSFIRGHPGQVSPVTITLGANDFLAAFHPSTCSVGSNLPAVMATFDANFRTILARLRTALNGRGDLLTMTYYDPYQNQCARNPRALAFIREGNAHLVADAAAYHVPVADVFAAFGGPATPNSHLCTYTWICSGYHDIHPRRQGYTVIASTFEGAAGY